MKNKSIILGISAYYHDSAACILNNGEIIAAAQEERFTRKNTILISQLMHFFPDSDDRHYNKEAYKLVSDQIINYLRKEYSI